MLTDKFSERSKMRRLATTLRRFDHAYKQLLTETQEAKFNG